MHPEPLKLYVNPAWRRTGIHTPLLNPWWGNPYENSAIFAKQMFDALSFDTRYYAITDNIEEADMVLPPYPHIWFVRHDMPLFDECVQTAQKADLPLLIDGMGDVEYPINAGRAFILRYGGYRFLPERGRISVPLLADDLLERCRDGVLDIRKKQSSRPVVGFAGWTELTPQQLFRTIIKEFPVRLRGIMNDRYRACTKGVLWRRKTITLLQQSSRVALNLRLRHSFSASHKTAEKDMGELREEMIRTITESDYALDVRGDANNSTRLFEILSLGRIPIIVDTERNFPFSDKIDYSSFALIVDFRDIKRLPERIAEFHEAISSERFEQMQRNARDAYRNYFRIDAMTRLIMQELPVR